MASGSILQRSKKHKAIGLFQKGKFAEAKVLLKTICSKGAGRSDAEAWCLLAAVHGELGDYEAAIDCSKKAVQLVPAYMDAHYNLGQAMMHVGDFQGAVSAYQQVLKLQPEHPTANNHLGLVFEWLGLYHDALKCYRRSLKLNPGDVNTLVNLASIYQNTGEQKLGVECLQTAISLDPGYIKAYISLGLALMQQGDLDEAVRILKHVRKLDPDDTDVEIAMAAVLEQQGDFVKAYQTIQPLLEADTASERLAVTFARIARHVDRKKDAIAMLEHVLGKGGLKPAEAQPLHFQLGKLYDDAKEYDKAFPHFEAANDVITDFYAADNYIDEMDEVMSICTKETFDQSETSGCNSQRPIFIVGMPRSGTTLTEQILASHPLVFGGGERQDIGTITGRLKDMVGGIEYPKCLPSLSKSVLSRLVEIYNDGTPGEADNMVRITDKMPHNFQHLGLIALMFPNAHIVHCKRNPTDTCFSIYTSGFNAVHGYASDLTELGKHYRKYQQLMAHWKAVLPLPILEIKYEDMVADQERVSRELIEFCGLPWDEKCLHFYKSGRVATTMSYDQVRKPIYTRSVERWLNYASFLKPLRESLGLE